MIRHRIAVLAAGALVLLSACGTSEQPAEANEPSQPSANPVTVTDSRGKEIKLDAPAKDVVALEWGEAEMLVTLGVMPVGVADVEGYNTWVTAEQLGDDVKDVGTRQEPSVDAVVNIPGLDLVIMEEQRGSNVVSRLEEYVPVLVTKGSDASNNLQRLRDDFTMVAKAVGKEDVAEQVLADFDTSVADAKEKLAEAGMDGASFVMADGYQQGNAISIRPFGEGSLVSQVLIAAGLTNAWQGEVDPLWGLGQTDVEGLTTITDENVHFFYNASDGNDIFAQGLKENPIWQSLPFVKAGNVHRLTDGIWTFGGPASCEQYLNEIVGILTE